MASKKRDVHLSIDENVWTEFNKKVLDETKSAKKASDTIEKLMIIYLKGDIKLG